MPGSMSLGRHKKNSHAAKCIGRLTEIKSLKLKHTKNDGLEHVSFQIWQFWVSMLSFRKVMLNITHRRYSNIRNLRIAS